MKKFLAIIGLAVLTLAFTAITVQAQAPAYGAVTVYSTNNATAMNGGTAHVLASGTGSLDVRKQKDVAVQITMYPKTTATDAVTFYFYRSIDGSTYASPFEWSVALAPSGTAGTASTVVTNIPAAMTYGTGYLRLGYLTNAAAAAGVVTNISVKYGVKILAP